MSLLETWPRVALAAAASALLAGAPTGVAGAWRLSAIGGKVGCTLSLTDATAIGGFEVKVPPACRLAFPPIKDLTAWSVDEKGQIVFSDPVRRRIVSFQPRTEGVWEGQGQDGAAWRLEKAAPRGGSRKRRRQRSSRRPHPAAAPALDRRSGPLGLPNLRRGG